MAPLLWPLLLDFDSRQEWVLLLLKYRCFFLLKIPSQPPYLNIYLLLLSLFTDKWTPFTLCHLIIPRPRLVSTLSISPSTWSLITLPYHSTYTTFEVWTRCFDLSPKSKIANQANKTLLGRIFRVPSTKSSSQLRSSLRCRKPKPIRARTISEKLSLNYTNLRITNPVPRRSLNTVTLNKIRSYQ